MKVFKHKPAPSVTPRSGVVVVDVGLVVRQVAIERGDNITWSRQQIRIPRSLVVASSCVPCTPNNSPGDGCLAKWCSNLFCVGICILQLNFCSIFLLLSTILSPAAKKSDDCKIGRTSDSQWRWRAGTSGWNFPSCSNMQEILTLTPPVNADQTNPKTNCGGSKKVLGLRSRSWPKVSFQWTLAPGSTLARGVWSTL